MGLLDYETHQGGQVNKLEVEPIGKEEGGEILSNTMKYWGGWIMVFRDEEEAHDTYNS